MDNKILININILEMNYKPNTNIKILKENFIKKYSLK